MSPHPAPHGSSGQLVWAKQVVQGIQVGHRATWFGGGRARPAGASAGSLIDTSSPHKRWRLAGEAARVIGP
jgi:hypothetical protein